MLTQLFNLKIAAIINISISSLSLWVCLDLFFLCTYGIHMQKSINAFIFSYLQIFVFWVLVFYRGTISYFFTAHNVVVSLLTRASSSENEY